MSQITGYDPSDSTLLEIGRDLRDTSEQLYTRCQLDDEEDYFSKGKK